MKLGKKFLSLIMLLLVTIMSFGNMNNKAQAISPASDRLYKGVDVSSWQGYIDYEKVRRDGIEIVYIKSSEGSNFKDPYFDTNYENAKRYGLKVGVYHFLTARNEREAREQAEFFHKVIEGKEIDCRLAMDFEQFGGIGREEIRRVSKAFIEEVERITKKEVIIYSDLSNARGVFSTDELTKYPLWIAYYGNYRELNNINLRWEKWTGVQYDDKGKVRGIRGDVDRDFFTREAFLKDSSRIIKANTDKKITNTRRRKYKVKRGDTIYDLAKKYKTTIDEIVRLNKIINKDLIYINQEIEILENTRIEGREERGTSNVFYTIKKRR